MKKIIALITLFVITFTSGYATVGESIKLTKDDILKANIFYINGQGYIKEDNKLKKIKGIEFYSIAGKRYIKKDGEIIKVTENKVFKINNTNYVVDNGKLITLEKYLKENVIKYEEEKEKDQVTFKLEKKENLELRYLQEYKIEKIKSEVAEKVANMILEKYPNNISSTNLLKKGKFNTDNLTKIREHYYNLGDIEIAKEIFKLENISKIDITKVNTAIRAKLNNSNIKYVHNNTNTKIDSTIKTNTCYGDEPEWSDYGKYSSEGEHTYYNEIGHAYYKSTCTDTGNFVNTYFSECEEGYELLEGLHKIDKDGPKKACGLKINTTNNNFDHLNNNSDQDNINQDNINQNIQELFKIFEGL